MTRTIVYLIHAALLCLVVTDARGQTPVPPPAATRAEPPRQLNLTSKPWTGDFDKMLERRIIRIYMPYSRSQYFIDKGRERGLGAELARDVERYLNAKYAKELGKRPLTVYIVAATRDKLLSDLTEGFADIAMGNLTVTADRLKVVRLVLAGASRRVLVGLLLGVPLAIGAGKLIATQLYGVASWDPPALIVAAGALAISAFFAAIIPAGRAASISPMTALRTE